MQEPFEHTLERRGLSLTRGELTTLQVNVGLACQLTCKHCHLDASPRRTERMNRGTMQRVVNLATRHPFRVIDITGGEPALNPHLAWLLRALSPLTPSLLLRTNLMIFDGGDPRGEALLPLCRQLKVTLFASFPSLDRKQTDGQRGPGVQARSLAAVARLNSAGYGMPDSGLDLILIANPIGAEMAGAQGATEASFRERLEKEHGLHFTRLFTLGNSALGRHRSYLERNVNLGAYRDELAGKFNAATLPALMCRQILSVRWDGALFDCDFNLALGLPAGGNSPPADLDSPLPPPGAPIAVGDHCYACTAGSGFT